MEEEIVKTNSAAKTEALAKARAAKAAKKAAAAPEEPTRQHKAEPEPAEEREHRMGRSGRIEATGRDGEVLSRGAVYVRDSFEVDKPLIPEGWDYQWNSISIHGNAEVVRDMHNLMTQQGWRPVPAERYAGTLLPRGAKGNIVRGGVILEERPTVLGNEARQEELNAARKLISDRNESLKLAGVKKNMPDGFEMGGQYKGTGGDIRMSIDKGLDIPAPGYTLAKPGE